MRLACSLRARLERLSRWIMVSKMWVQGYNSHDKLEYTGQG